MSRAARCLAAGFLVVLTLPSLARAQARLTGADLVGRVTDESKAVLPGATVTVTNRDTNVTRTATTDGQGEFKVPALPPGTYKVTAAVQGFASQTRDGVTLQLGQTVDLEVTLKIAGTQEELTIVSEAPVVDVTDTSVSTVVGQQQIENLPINGRNFISFAIITPGAGVDNTPQQGASATSGLTFAGQRARSNNVMVDGLDNNDAGLGSVRAVFSQEAVREFQVLTNSYSAEFGKASGGVVNIVTKSGTNELHGNVFFYFRDDSLNAKGHFEQVDVFGNPVSREKAPFKQHQYGATLGGPLKKDKTFFFLAFERLDTEANNFVTISAADAANLSRAGFLVTPGANPYDVKQTQLLAKVDHQWSPNSSLVFRANYSDTLNQNIEPFGGLVARSRGAEQDRQDWSLSLAQTNILSTRWVNEARVQYARQDQKINSLDPNCSGPCDRDDEGGPTLELLPGGASLGRQRFTPQPRINDRIQVTDTVSYFGGRHSLKAGVDFNWIDNHDQSLPLHFGGRYLFQALPAVPPLGIPTPLSPSQAVAAGFPVAYIQGYGQGTIPYGYQDLSIFLQDEWRVSRKLTIKPGVRYQKQFWPSVPHDVSDLNGSRLRYEFPQDNDNIAPRISFAFDPKGEGRTSLHAAYGLFFDNHITSIVGITDGIDGSANGVRTLVARGFPNSVVLAAWRAPNHRLTEAQAQALLGGAFPSLVISIDPGLETPYAHQVAAGFDQAIGKDLAVTANFLYVRGQHQLGTLDYNPTLPSLGVGRRPNDVGGRAGTSASVLQYTDFGETWYRGLTVAISKRLSHRYQFLLSYTLSKAEDNSTDFQSAFIAQDNGRGRNPADPTGLPLGFNPDSERGPATWDQRHRFVFSGLYQFPWDIQLSTIVAAASGRPFTALAIADLNADGNGGSIPGSDRARRTPADIGTSLGRNSENLPKQVTVDLRLSKKFRFGRSAALEAIVEAFNLFDRTNYTEVDNAFGVGAFPDNPARDAQGRTTYGRFTQAAAPRQIQLAAKLSF